MNLQEIFFLKSPFATFHLILAPLVQLIQIGNNQQESIFEWDSILCVHKPP
jgi:hypothetical protein